MKRAAQQAADAVDEAMSTKDFSGLSATIGGIIRHAALSALDPDGSRSGGQETKPAVPPQTAHPERFFAAPDGAEGKKILGIVGAALAVIFGLMTLGFGLLAAHVTSLMMPLAACFGAAAALGALLAVRGFRAGKKAERFRIYREMLLPRLYAGVKDLARAAGRTEAQAVEDLEGFCREGKIRQGHFDAAKSCFIASDELYLQYQAAAARDRERKEAEEAARKKEEQIAPEVRDILTKGEACIETIRRANDEIGDPAISDKLDRMEETVRRIFSEVKSRPSLASRLGMFMNYYLPTTAKLVSAYAEMDRQGADGETVRQSKKEIADSLDSINDAFGKLLDGFFRDQAMDVSADIQVMKMMMKQEGLTKDDLGARA